MRNMFFVLLMLLKKVCEKRTLLKNNNKIYFSHAKGHITLLNTGL